MSGSTDAIRVLHVDDDPDLAEMVGAFLERADDRFDVVTATSAAEGIDELAADRVDCIVSDYEMPGQNGIEFLREVREGHPDLPFILFTGRGSEEVAIDAISAGVTDYLQKETGTGQYELLANKIGNAVQQHRAEREIDRTRRRFRTLVEETTDVILIVDPTGEIDYATPSAEAVLGRTPDELVGTNGFAQVHPEDLQRVQATFDELLENPAGRRSLEFRYERPDGSWIWVEARGRNLLDVPVIDGVVVYVRDTTERTERELALRRQERRYQAVFNDPNILVGLVEPDGTLLDVNDTAMGYIDASVDDVVGTPFWETPWFDHSERVREDVRDWVDRAADGEYVEFELDLLEPDGTAYAIEGVIRPVTDEDGEVLSLIVSDRVVTARKARERELERIRDFFTEAERLGNLGAWEFDATGEAVWTDGTRRIHEVDADYEPTVEAGLEFFHPDDRPEVERAVEAAVAAGEAYDTEARLVTAEGNERWVRIQGAPVDDAAADATVRGYIQDVTNQKAREQELREAKSQLEAALAAGAVGTWEWHVPSDTLTVGAEFAETFGVEPATAREGVPLERFLASIHEADRERVEGAIETALETCGDYEAEYRVRNRDGDRRWVAARGHVECAEDGTPVRFPGVLTDVTDRVQREEHLVRQQSLLEAVIETSLDGILVVDEHREPVAWNHQFVEMWEVPSRLIEAGPDERVFEWVRGALENPDAFLETVEHLYEHPRESSRDQVHLADGRVFDRYSAPVEVDDGTTGGRVWFFRDITERRARETALEQLHTATREGMAATTTEDVAEIASETATRILDLPMNSIHVYDADTDALEPIVWSDGVESIFDGRPPSIPADTGLVWQAYRTGVSQSFSDVRQAEDVLNPSTPFRSELHLPLGDHGVLLAASTEADGFDSTDETLAQVLAANVEAALDRVDREQELKRQNERLDEFASIVSHDLRNPLNVANGRLELVQGEFESEDLDAIERAHDRMGALVDDLLTLARHGERVEAVVAVDLPAVAQSCWGHVETADADLCVETEATVLADEPRLAQLLENLFRNAVEHGGASVTVTVGDLEDGTGFYVADSGSGIPADECEAVFESGYSTSDEGTGFGLAIVKRIVEAHGWGIAIEASSAGGARFEVRGVDVAE